MLQAVLYTSPVSVAHLPPLLLVSAEWKYLKYKYWVDAIRTLIQLAVGLLPYSQSRNILNQKEKF